MRRSFLQMLLLTNLLLATAVWAQAPILRMWYRGAFEGWAELRSEPVYGWYYYPSPNKAYPLNEAQYGQPLPCAKCGHWHYPGQEVCPVCGPRCPKGGKGLQGNVIYSLYRLPGQYYYEQQPHYRFTAPMRLGGTYRKYNQPFDLPRF